MHRFTYDTQDTPEEKARRIAELEQMTDEELIKAGKTLEQVKAATPAAGFVRRYGSNNGPWTTDMFVEAVYKSLVTEKSS